MPRGDDEPDDTDTPAPRRGRRRHAAGRETRRDLHDEATSGRRARSGFPAWGWVLVAVGGLALVGLLAFGGLALVGFVFLAHRPAVPAPAQVAVPKRIWGRDDFHALVAGKTSEQVTAAVGRPDRTEEANGDTRRHYDGVTTDPVTGRIDGSVQVTFRDGRVTGIAY